MKKIALLVPAMLFTAVGAVHATDPALQSFDSLVAGMHNGCIEQGNREGLDSAAVTKWCQCVMDTLNTNLDQNQLAEFIHGMALGKKTVKTFNLDEIQSKLNNCQP